LVRDDSETFTAAEVTVKKKKKPVIQETSYQISAWKKSVSGMQEETSYTSCTRNQLSDLCRSGRKKEDHRSTRNQLSDLC